jgi:hypothetical protein
VRGWIRAGGTPGTAQGGGWQELARRRESKSWQVCAIRKAILQVKYSLRADGSNHFVITGAVVFIEPCVLLCACPPAECCIFFVGSQ